MEPTKFKRSIIILHLIQDASPLVSHKTQVVFYIVFMNILKKLWNDPVGASVIGSIIFLVLASICAAIIRCYGGGNYIETLWRIANYDVKFWIVILIVIAYFILKGIVTKYASFRYDSHSYENDKKIYDTILKSLSNNGIIYFLRTNNFAGFSFRLSSLEELDNFYHSYIDDPNFEFLNPKLEEMRKKLMGDIDEFEGLIAENTFPGTREDLQTVPPEWESKCPNHFWDVVNKIHNSAKNICSDYDMIVKYGKREIKQA